MPGPVLHLPGRSTRWLDRRITGDRPPRGLLAAHAADLANRTAIGAAGITFYGLLWAAAANDQIAYHLAPGPLHGHLVIPGAVLAGPVLAFLLTRADLPRLARPATGRGRHGRETGRIVMNPDGGYTEIREPVPSPRAPVAVAGSRRGLEGSSRGS